MPAGIASWRNPAVRVKTSTLGRAGWLSGGATASKDARAMIGSTFMGGLARWYDQSQPPDDEEVEKSSPLRKGGAFEDQGAAYLTANSTVLAWEGRSGPIAGGRDYREPFPWGPSPSSYSWRR